MLILSVGQVPESENAKHLPLEGFKIVPEVKYSHIMILSESTLISYEKISEIMSCLEVHGKITIKYERDVKASDAETEMKLCGLLSVVLKEAIEGRATVLEGIKPDLSSGAAQRRPIKRPSKEALKAFLSSESPNDLIKDSNLLKEEDLIKPAGMAEGEECGPKAKKKACKNCSCGLREVEEAEATEKKEKEEQEQSVIDTLNVKSSCGSVRLFVLIYFNLFKLINLFLVLFGRCF
jgi:anamorsin